MSKISFVFSSFHCFCRKLCCQSSCGSFDSNLSVIQLLSRSYCLYLVFSSFKMVGVIFSQFVLLGAHGDLCVICNYISIIAVVSQVPSHVPLFVSITSSILLCL